MARLPRLSLAGHAHLLTQTASGGLRVFLDESDADAFLGMVSEAASNRQVAVHGFRLAPDAFQILATPDDESGISAFMQDIGRRYVRWVNTRYRRLGALWAGRFRSLLVQPGATLLAAMIFLDRRPGLAQTGLFEELPLRTSAEHYTGHRVSRFLVAPPPYWTLGDTPFAREAAYASLVHQGLDAPFQERIATAIQSGRVLGDTDFIQNLEKVTSRPLSKGKPGRPHKRPSGPITEENRKKSE